jgi:hypothetical protein
MKVKMFCLIVLVVLPAGLFAQATDCNDPHASPQANAIAQQQWDNRSSPVYQDATELARTLNERGLPVQCIRRSVGERIFKGQKGAAWFKTDRGVFDVWFLPASESFADLKIQERQEEGEYIYTFSGIPQISRTIEGSKRSFFVPCRNFLFLVSGDGQLATSLRNACQTP